MMYKHEFAHWQNIENQDKQNGIIPLLKENLE